jgi:O-antigen/teichoic acid export membrane protein
MNYVGQAAGGVSALVVTPLLLHRLGRPAFGIWVLASSVIGYLELFEFGFGGAAVKLIAEDAYVRPNRCLRTLNTALAVLIALGILALSLALLLAVFSPHLFRIPDGLRGQTVVTFAVLGLGLAVSIPGDVFGGALQGFQRFDLLSTANTLLVVSLTSLSLAVVLGGGGLVALAAASTIASISFHAVRWAMLRRIFPEARLRARLVDRARLRSTAQLSGWFLLRDVANTVTSTADLVVVSIIFGVRATAVYAVGFKLAQVAAQARGAYTVMLFPHASATARDDGTVGLRELIVRATRIAMVTSVLPALVLAVLAFPGIRQWVGPGYGTSARVLLVLVAASVVTSLVQPMATILSGGGQARTLSLLASGNAVCNLGLSILLAHLVGPVGVALGTLGGAVLVWVPSVLVSGARTVGVRPAELIRLSFLPHVVPALGTAGVLILLRDTIGDSIAGVAVAAAAGALTYLTLYLALAASPEERARFRASARSLSSRWLSSRAVNER